jgi:hypothetical protein
MHAVFKPNCSGRCLAGLLVLVSAAAAAALPAVVLCTSTWQHFKPWHSCRVPSSLRRSPFAYLHCHKLHQL